jgi:hypothetical protein
MVIDLSIVVLTMNDAENCLKTILSIYEKVDCQTIIVDCNKERDLVLLNNIELIPFSKQTIFSHFPDSTISSAMNYGASQSRNKWIWFLNSGDLINKIDILEVSNHESSELNLLVGSTTIYNGKDDARIWRDVNPEDFKFKYGINTICHQACIFNRQSLINSGGFIEAPHFDWVSTFTLSRNGASTKLRGLEVLYLTGGKSSEESLFLWGLNNFKLRKKLRSLFKGNLYFDLFVYLTYIPTRMIFNIICRNRHLSRWWKVGN